MTFLLDTLMKNACNTNTKAGIDDVKILSNEEIVTAKLEESPLVSSDTSGDDLVQALKESLTVEDFVPVEILTQINSEWTGETIRFVFTNLRECLDAQMICKLGDSVARATFPIKDYVASNFIACILLPKVSFGFL